ncbi:MAG: hypothetical protein KBB86_02860 [Candidatus Pacebacteria bacterium]|nr:hypothetical protein [Candidatus Paceibacterota bacterium]
MNDRKRKILIITLIAVTILVILYIVYLFMGKKPITTTGSGGSTFSGFGNLLSKKKTTPPGSQINPDGTPVDIGADTQIPDSGIDQGDSGNPGNVNTGTDPIQSNTPNLNALPSPGTGGTTVNPNGPVEIPIDITTIDDPKTDPTKKKKCDKNALPKGVLNILCEDAGLMHYGQNVDIVSFSLNNEEQQELDRLSRMFARIAPYLKTETDVLQEQSNQEAYEEFTVTANRLARETDAEVRSSGYRGPKEIQNPFLTSQEFGSKLGYQLNLELLGYPERDFRIRIWDLLGMKLGNLFGNKEDDKDNEFREDLANLLSDRIVKTLDNFIGGPTTCPSGSLKNCGSELFEKALDIY